MEGKRKALVIGISEYTDQSLPKLDFCKNDGNEMYKTLIELGYEIPQNQKIIGEANKKTIEDTIIDFFRDESVSTSDTLLFYFSGHGVLDGYGGRFFANTDVSSTLPEKNGVRFEMLNEQMGKSIADKKIAILDCCFSGGAVASLTGKSGDNLEKEAEDLGSEGLHQVFGKSQGSCILASSLSTKKSFPLADESFSAFTRFIIDGLKGNKNSVDENGFVTPEKLSKYVYAEMEKIPGLANQKPVRNLSISGDLILAEHKNLAKKTSKSDELKKLEQEIQNLKEKNKLLEVENQKLIGEDNALFEKWGIKNNTTLDEKIKIPDSVINQLNETEELQAKIVEQQGTKPEIDPDYLIKKATTYYFGNKLDKAIELYDLVLKNFPKKTSALIMRGKIEAEGGKNLEALKWYDKALEIDPKNIDTLNKKGRLLHSMGKFIEAINCFDAVLEIDSENVIANHHKETAQKGKILPY